MGGADVIPGVSGGTVALILGIYQRLVTAISHFDVVLLGHLRKREWGKAAEHVDLAFLGALLGGIALGIGSLAGLMHYLLEHQRQQTFAVFFGLIVASSALVGQMVSSWNWDTALLVVAGTAFAYLLVGLPFLQTPPDNAAYLFACGAVSICAMILPGISGAFILLILGKYYDVIGSLKSVLHLDITGQALETVGVFLLGAAVGLLSFSKVLNWLLDHHKSYTMAVLCGFMIGSLRKIWPFAKDLTPDVAKFKLKQFENVAPDFGDGSVWLSILLAVLAVVFVFVLDRLSNGPKVVAADGDAS